MHVTALVAVHDHEPGLPGAGTLLALLGDEMLDTLDPALGAFRFRH